MKYLMIIISIINSIFSLEAFSEYRAYQLMVKDPLHPALEAKIITSSLNPLTYKTYHGKNLEVTLLNTWMCPGNTSKRKVCPFPFEANPEEIGIKKK